MRATGAYRHTSLAYTGYIEQILDQLEQNPAQARKSLRTAWEQSPPAEFRAATVGLIARGQGAGPRFLVTFLLQNDALESNLGNHDAYTREEALTIARVAHKVDPSLDVKLAMQLAGRHVTEEKDAGRILDILEVISQPSTLLPLMSGIMQHPNAKVRSKAALLMGKGNRNAAWVRQQLREPNERVRANAVESLWGLDSDDIVSLFHAASIDTHRRTAVNGMVGLYLSHKIESLSLLANAAQHGDAHFRASAAWGMGHTHDLRFVPPLTRLVRDADPTVRSNALKAVGKVRAFRKLIESQAAFRAWIGTAVRHADGWRELSGVVRANGTPPALHPLQYVVDESGRFVYNYQVAVRPETEMAAGFVMPQAAAVDRAWAVLKAERRPQDSWNAAVYTDSGVDRQAGQYSNFLRALIALLPQLPVRDHRAIFVAGSPVFDSSEIDTGREQIQKLIQDATNASVRIHAITPPVCAPVMRVTLHEVARSTGGRYIETSSEEAFEKGIVSLGMTLFPSFQIRYRLEEPAAAKVKLLISSPAGIGECEADLSGA